MPTDNNDGDDRPHYHISGDVDDPRIYLDDSCAFTNLCRIDDPVVVVALDDYRALVAAARDRHPTNQQRRPDPTSHTDYISERFAYLYSDDRNPADS